MKKWIQVKKNWSSQAGDSERIEKPNILSIFISFFIVALLILVLVKNQGNIEDSVARFASFLPIGYAFAAGMVASVNPCGVMMLTSYTFQQIKQKDQLKLARQITGWLLKTILISGSFLVLFLGIGLIVSLGNRWVIDAFPIIGLVVGLVMIGIGLWLVITNQTLSLGRKKDIHLRDSNSLGGAILFGFSYALASLSCTLPIFLVVVGSALGGEATLWLGLSQFAAYALGMGLVVLIVFIGAGLFKRALGRWLRKVTPLVHRMSSIFLIGAGVYLVYYWINAGLF